MNERNKKTKYQLFTEDKDFDGDIEEENEKEEDNKIEKKLESSLHNKDINKNIFDEEINDKISKKSNKSKNSKKISNKSLSKKINKNIKFKEYIESNISNSVISENSIPRITKTQSNNEKPMFLEININSEMKKKIDKDNKKKNLTLLIQDSNLKIKNKKDNIFDNTYNTTNSSQLDNSKFLLNKLKGNKLLQELKLKESINNKFRYYGKDNLQENNNNNKAIIFNIIDNKNNLDEKLNKNKEEKKKKNNKILNYFKRKKNYSRFSFKCGCKCYIKNICKINRNCRFNTITLIRNIFVFLVICSAIGFYSIILFHS